MKKEPNRNLIPWRKSLCTLKLNGRTPLMRKCIKRKDKLKQMLEHLKHSWTNCKPNETAKFWWKTNSSKIWWKPSKPNQNVWIK